MSGQPIVFSVPQEISYSPQHRQAIVLHEHIASLTKSGDLTIYSVIRRSNLFELSDVHHVMWIDATWSASPILLAFVRDAQRYGADSAHGIRVLSTSGSVPRCEIYDTRSLLCLFTPVKVGEAWQLADFRVEFNVASFWNGGRDQCYCLDTEGGLLRFLVCASGLYVMNKVPSEKCKHFAFSGQFLAGTSSDSVHIWTRRLEHLSTVSFAATSISAVAIDRFAIVVVGSVIAINANDASTTQLEADDASGFIYLRDDQTVIGQPLHSLVVQSSAFCRRLRDRDVRRADNLRLGHPPVPARSRDDLALVARRDRLGLASGAREYDRATPI
jgi:hypothetical protein